MSNFLHKYLLLIIVFITGAAVLVIEVAATRILSPHFGNTIFTVSSVISVILLALSVGYFVGGRLADKRPSEFLFFQLIALSGLSVFLLQLLKMSLLPVLSKTLDIQSGPMITSALLFLLPGLMLGMLSPLVAKLQQARLQKEGIGTITGDVFFWSTLGSITGSLATGFLLIPAFGIDQIIIGTGIVLLIIGVLGMSAARKNAVSKGKLFILFFALPLLLSTLQGLNDRMVRSTVVFADDGVYDNILIYDDTYNGKPARFLQQATDASSAMYLESDELVYEYTKFYELYKLTKPDLQHAYVIGGGAYSVPKVLYQTDPDVQIDVAEIEPKLFEAGKKYFRVPDSSRFRNHVEDGRRFLRDTDTKYDFIFTDAYHYSIPSHLTTKEFFALTKEKLSPDGVYMMNVIGSLKQTTPSFLMSQIKTFRTVYPNSYFFAVYDPNTESPQNTILVGYNSDKKIDFNNLQTNDEYTKTVASRQIDVSKLDLAPHKIFTDDYAPVEYYIMNHQY